jgi:hypothetical protein
VREGFNLLDLEPGDYYGPVSGYTGDKASVFFRLPRVIEGDRGLRHVASPPHVFRECPDGSLEIRESIGALGDHGTQGYLWHGYLDEGNVWREV